MITIPHPKSPHALLALALTAPAVASAAILPSTAAAATTPTPRLFASWRTLHEACTTTTRTVHVHRHGRRVTEHRHARHCSEKAARVHGDTVHLRWHQHGKVFGHLSLAGAPVAGAQVIFHQQIPRHHGRTETLTTNAKGQFSARFRGPSGHINLTYTTSTGTVLVKTHRITARGYLSLHISKLRAGHRAHFYGLVAGGYEPENLYIQFWYYAGPRSGYQPFAHLALVDRRTGHWSARVPIPHNTAGFHYRIRATVVRSPEWPYAPTSSPTVRRVVA